MAKHELDDFEELDLGLDDDMGYEDTERPSNDRKASIFSRARKYAKNHYKSKLDDRGERKRLLKQALPGSYSSSVDLALDLKDDYDTIKYEVGKEWQKTKGPFKKLLKTQEGTLRMLRLKKLADWADQEERGSYADEEVDQDEALTANLMGDFTKFRNSPADKEQKAENQIEQKEKEDEREYRTKSLTTQMRGTANLGSILKELRNQTSYQDQITFQYQRKNLEFNIRNYIESKKQTEILRTYKEESILELKEIHKNTGLPEAVKINQSELAGQIFKEKMLGNVATYFDGKFSGLRKRVVARVKDKLIEMTRDFGSTIEGMLDTANSQQESGGGSLLGMFGQMFADSWLDKPYRYVTDKVTGYARSKLGANSKLGKFGKGLDSLISNAGTLGNEALITGKTGNKLLDGISGFFGLNQAATTRSTRLRNSLSENMDTAAYMDVKFKQTVERVIPGWLSLIHKETYLTRIGSSSDKDYKKKAWDWDKEDFDDEQNVKDRAFTQVFKKENIEQFSNAMENVLRVYDPIAFLTVEARDELKEWIYNKIQASRSPSYYNLMLEINTFKKKEVREQLKQIANFVADIHEEDLEYAEEGLLSEGKLIMRRPKYRDWAKKVKPYLDELSSRPLFNIEELMRVANTEQGKVLEEMGLVSRDGKGNLDLSVDYEKKIVKQLTSMDYKQIGKLKEIEGENYKNNQGKQEKRIKFDLTDENMSDQAQDWVNSDPKLIASVFNNLQRMLDSETLDLRAKKDLESKLKDIQSSLLFMNSAEYNDGKATGRITTRAAGGIIPSFGRGGRVRRKKHGKKSYLEAYKGGSTGEAPVDEGQLAIVHGQEFVSDAATTEKNEDLLELMNKFKAPVFLPDGKVNPVYYKAMGYGDEEEFRKDQSKQLKLARKKEKADKFVAATKTGSSWLVQQTRNMKKNEGKAKAAIQKAASDLKNEAKDIYNSAKKSVEDITEKQAQIKYQAMLNVTDTSIFNERETKVFASDASYKVKLMTLVGAKIREENRTELIANLSKQLGRQFLTSAKSKVKRFLNGGDDDTTNTDNLKEVYNYGKDKVTGAYGEVKKFAGEQFNKTALKGRYDQAKGLLQKAWKELAIDIYLVVNPSVVRLSASGFDSGMYIDKATGRVLGSHHDINGEVINVQGNVVLSDEELSKGLLDKEGNRINPSSLARYRNMARNKLVETYNKYAKKHVDKFIAKGTDALLSAAERWQRMTKETIIDIYVEGKGDKPILTAVGFRAGEYFSSTSKKLLTDYLDIDGPVMTKNGQYLLLQEDLDKLIDKEGKPVKPTKLQFAGQRLLNIVGNAIGFSKIKAHGLKMFDKAKAFSAKRIAENFSKAGADAIDVYLPGKLDKPVLYAKDFRDGLYLDQNSGEKLPNHYMIKGPVIKTLPNGSIEVVLTQEDLQKGFVDSDNKPLPAVKVDLLRASFFKGIGFGAGGVFSKFKKSKLGVKVSGLFERLKPKVEKINVEEETVTPKRNITFHLKDGYHRTDAARSLIRVCTEEDISAVRVFIRDMDENSGKKFTRWILTPADLNKLFYPSGDPCTAHVYVIKASEMDKVDFFSVKELFAASTKVDISYVHHNEWFDEEGNKLDLDKLSEMPKTEAAPSPLNKPGFKTRVGNWIKSKLGISDIEKNEGDGEVSTIKRFYYKDPISGMLVPAFSQHDIDNWLVYQMDPFAQDPDSTISRVSDWNELKKGYAIYRIMNIDNVPKDKPLTYALLQKIATAAVSSGNNHGVWYDEKGKKIKPPKKPKEKGQGLLTRGKGKLTAGVKGLKDKLMGKITDGEGNLRIGSWQWKRKKKEEDGWFSRLGSALGMGKKNKEGDPAKPSWMKTLFGFFTKKFIFMGLAAAGLIKALGAKISLGSMAAGLLAVKGISWALKNSLSTLVFKPLMNLIPWLGTKIMSAVRGRGLMGNGVGGLGRIARIGGAALGAAAIYKGLKGEEQYDENGDPIVDEEGKPVVQKDYMGAALGAVGVAAMIPGAGTAVMSAGAALLTNPVGWAALGGLAAGAAGYWLGKKALGWWKKGNALEDSPLSAFRMIQYGFSPIEEKTMTPILQLEDYLSGMLVSTNDGVNISNQVNPDTVFGFFGLKYGTGDSERNKAFLAWFLGRFKPVYLSYAKQMNALKKTYKLDGIDTGVPAADRLNILENVHFKNQTDMNPYNIPLSPFDDPDETDYDFDDVCDKYDDVKSILQGMVPASDKAKAEGGAKPGEEEKKEGGGLVDGAKKAAMFASPVGAAIMGLKWTAQKIGDVFNISADGMQKKFSDIMGKTFDKVSEKWASMKKWASNAWNSITNLDGEGMANAAKDVLQYAGPVGAAASSVIDLGQKAAGAISDFIGGKSNVKSVEIAEVLELGAGWNRVRTKDGSVVKITGNWNWRNNNPGNIENGEFAKKYGAFDLTNVKGDKKAKRFAIFPTYAHGRNAKANLIFNGANYKDLDLAGAINRYAPPSENNTQKYVNTVLQSVGINKRMATYSDDDKAKILDAMEKVEGYKSGSINVEVKGAGGDTVASNTAAAAGAVGGAGSAGKAAATLPATIAKPSATAAAAGGMVGNAMNKVAGGSSTPMIGIGGTDPTKTNTAAKTTAAAGAKTSSTNTGLAKFLAMVTPDLIAKGKAHCTIASNTTMTGMNENVANLFYSMIGDAVAKGCPKIHIREGVRTLAEQQRLWDRYQAYKRGQGPKAPAAARPGTSRHGFGFAIDINPEPSVSWLVKNGYLEKWGFERNLLQSLGEWWHIEHKLLKPKGCPTPQIPAPSQADKKQAAAAKTAAANPASQAPSTTGATGAASTPTGGVNTGNASLNTVVNSGGFGMTNTVANQQQVDTMNNSATNDILTRQLNVQTQIRDTLTELKEFIVKPVSAEERQRIEDLKKPMDSQTVGEEIGRHLSNIISEKLGGSKSHLDLQKPRAPISVSKF